MANVDFSAEIRDFRTAALGEDVRDSLVAIAEKLEDTANDTLVTADTQMKVVGENSSSTIWGDSTKHDVEVNDIQAEVNAIKAAVGSPLVASTKSAMTDQDKVYVYVGYESGMTNGNWYYYNGSAWTSGGVYQSQGLETDKTLSVENMAADAKYTGDAICDSEDTLTSIIGIQNLFDALTWNLGYYISASGVVTPLPSARYSDLFSVQSNFYTLHVESVGTDSTMRIHGYDENGEWVSQIKSQYVAAGNSYTFTFSTARYSYIRISYIPSNIKLLSFFEGITTLGEEATTLYSAMVHSDLLTEEADPSLWVLGSLDLLNGNEVPNSIRLRTGILNNVFGVISQNGYVYSLRCYNKSGVYVGCWDGTTFVTSSGNTNVWFDGKLIFPDALKDYNIKLVLANSSLGTITVSESENLIFIRNHAKDTNVYNVGDGYEYTRIRDAVAEAIQHNGASVIVHPGEYDLVNEFASEIAANQTDVLFGVKLENDVTVYFQPGSHVSAIYNGGIANITKCFNPFYAGNNGGYTLTGLDIESAYTRYCLHDENGAGEKPRAVVVRNCDMRLTSGTSSGYIQCIGGGLGKCDDILIEDCCLTNLTYSQSPATVLSYHNAARFSDAESRIVVRNCLATRTGRFSFRWLGTSPNITKVVVNNCKFGSAITVQAENASATVVNVELTEFNNTIGS